MLDVVIIEDELKSRDVLRHLIAKYCFDTTVVGEATTVDAGVDLINKHKPDLVFLDIELPGQNGFALFDYFADPPFEVIFTTAYDQFAIRAFRISAIDYLLKPINFKHLQEAVKKVVDKKGRLHNKKKIDILSSVVNNEQFDKIALPITGGYLFIRISKILYCKAERNYTSFILDDGKKHLVSKPLRYFEEILCQQHFFRINRSVIVNLHFIESYSRSNSGEVILNSQERFSVSDQVKSRLMERLNLPR